MKRIRESPSRAGAALCALLIGVSGRIEATTITNFFGYGLWLYSLAVNVGDTVMWVNQQPLYQGTNYVQSYDGSWMSPPLMEGDSFSFTFTKPGFYAYRTGLSPGGVPVAGAVPMAGTVAVMSTTGAPSLVTLNTPVEGSVLSPWGPVLHASVTNLDAIAQIQYFANSNLIGVGTNAPYEFRWQFALQGKYALVAKAIYRDGGTSTSAAVNVTVGPSIWVWGPRRLPTGEMLFFYNALPFRGSLFVVGSDNPVFSNRTNLAISAIVWSPGVFVDETVRTGTIQRRFYTIY